MQSGSINRLNSLRKYNANLLVLLTCVFNIGSVWSVEEKVVNDTDNVEWLLGMGAGVFSYHLYPGAKETNSLILPVPYFTYRSPTLEIDRGLKSFLYHGETIVLDISADFGLPVDSDDTRARQGMPDLDFMFQIGPSLEFLLGDIDKRDYDMRFELPVRAAFTSDFSGIDHIGYLIEPRISINQKRQGNEGVEQKVSIGLIFGTQDYHAYYYDVADEFATTTRMSYKSETGFGGSSIKYRISHRMDDIVYWAFLRYRSLHGAVFEDSPLVLEKNYLFFGVGFAWLFASSY